MDTILAQLEKNLPAMQETWIHPWVGKIPCCRERVSTPVFWPRESHGLEKSMGSNELDVTEGLLLFTFRWIHKVLFCFVFKSH